MCEDSNKVIDIRSNNYDNLNFNFIHLYLILSELLL